MASLKLFHLFFLFVWMGSLLALTRFLGYLPKEEPSVQNRILRILRRTYLMIDLPSMSLSLILGVLLFIAKGVDFSQGWLHMKLTFVAFLIVCDIVTGRSILRLSRENKSCRGVRYKILHGVTALSLIALLVSVYIVKNKVSTDSSLAKKGETDMILPLKTNGNS